MRRNIEKTITAFLGGRRHTERVCSTQDSVLKSYLMPIARRVKTGAVMLVHEEASPSQTTNSHIRAVAFTCELIGIPLYRVTTRQLNGVDNTKVSD